MLSDHWWNLKQPPPSRSSYRYFTDVCTWMIQTAGQVGVVTSHITSQERPNSLAARVYCSVNQSLTDFKMDIKCTEKPPAEIIVLFLLKCSCTCPKWGKQEKAQDKLRHSTEVQESRTFTFWQIRLEQKKDCSLGNSVRKETARVWGWEGLFTWTKWHEDMFDIQEVNSSHCPKRYESSFLLEVVQPKAFTQSMQSHRDCSAQHVLLLAWQTQEGSLQHSHPL